MRRLVLLTVLVLAAATFGLVPRTYAQDKAAEKEQLEKKRADLDGEIAGLNRTIDELQTDLDARTRELRRVSAKLEVTADEFAQTVEARKRPARTRLLIALDAYERGDRRVDNFLADLLLESIDADRVSKLATQREIYSTVVEDTEAQLRAIDDALRALRTRVNEQQSVVKGAQSQVDAVAAKKKQTEQRLQQAAAERADAQRRIDQILASTVTGLLTGMPTFEDRNRGALVIKIDNVEEARPPVGVNQADVVFEELVEGGLTRLAAVFQSRGADPVGPVRSARSTDVHLFANLNRPLFANSGGNSGVRSELAASTLIDVGNSEVPAAYYRDDQRVLPHNLFTSTSELWKARGKDAGTPPALFSFRPSGTAAGGVAAKGVSIKFPTLVEYNWNGSGWTRSQRGTTHVDARGTPIAPANVIVQFTQYKQSNADPNSPEAIVTGTGEAWVFTAGRVIRGNWSRKSDDSVTTYTDVDGKPILLTPGNTWIELPRPGSAESY